MKQRQRKTDIDEENTKVRRFSPKQAKAVVISGGALALVLFTIALAIAIQADPYSVTTYSMERYVQQTLYGKNQEKAAKEAANRIAALENLISWKAVDSDVGRLNENAGGEFQTINAATWQILSLCKAVYGESGGAFDCTIFPLTRLWNSANRQAVPTAEQVESARKDVDGERLLLGENNTAALKNRGMAIDLNMVEKGAACDVAVKTYAEMQVGSGIVAVGSTVGVYGTKFGGAPWQIALENPVEDGAIGELHITAGFVSTCTANERRITQDGEQNQQLLSPKTGYPADSGLLLAAVLADSGALSDALANACFVLGPEDGLNLLKKYGAEGIFITAEKKVIATEGIRKHCVIADEAYIWKD